MRNYRDLAVWHKAHALTLAVYKATKAFPQSEIYGLTSQIRRASSSIAANIAEGCGLGSVAELRKHCQIAMGSAAELDYHLLLSHDLGYLDEAAYRELAELTVEVQKMLSSFIVRLREPTRSQEYQNGGSSEAIVSDDIAGLQ
ncbi:MAG TPA: four helix bundle protein [Dehalococcoidia bacterium]|nr:four helix bundle protein [Dehalococcoidia bacterium]